MTRIAMIGAGSVAFYRRLVKDFTGVVLNTQPPEE